MIWTKPLRYLRYRHLEKFVIELLVPSCVATLFLAFSMAFPNHFLTWVDVVAVQVNSLLSILAGLFVAGLGLIATLDTPMLRGALGGTSPEIWNSQYGEYVKPSRREFYSLQFGYLVIATIVAFGIGITIIVLSSEFCASCDPPIPAQGGSTPDLWFLVVAASTAYSWLLTHILSITAIGVGFLATKLPEGSHD